jgi:hypothetical protein
MENIKIHKLSVGTVYKIVAIGFAVGLMPFFLICGIFGAFGFEALSWNNQPVTGIKAIFLGPLMAIFMSLIFTAVMGSICAFGLWIYSFVKPIQIEFKPELKQEPEQLKEG